MAEPATDPVDNQPTDDDFMVTGEREDSPPTKCYVHTVTFQDVGLVWSDQRRRALNGQQTSKASATATAASTQEELEQEGLELAALQELGLPSSFGVSRNALATTSHHQAQGAAWSPQPTPSINKNDQIFNTTQWIQAIDPGTGYFYYYCEALKLTQWEPPSEGYTPVDSPNTAWWMPPGEIEEEGGVPGGEVQLQQPTAMEGVSVAGEEKNVSPYAEAVASYELYHGWPEGCNKVEGVQHSINLPVLVKLDADLQQASAQQQQPQHQQERKPEVPGQEEAPKKPQPRVETTGLLPYIPQPDPGHHLRFGTSSSSSSGSSDGEQEENKDEQEDDELITTTDALAEEYQAKIDTNTVSIGTKRNRRRQRRRQRKVHAVDGTDHQGRIVVPPRLHKYWLQRYSFFSKYDQGILIDEEGWYSVTPEVIAWHHAKRLVASVGSRRCLAVDAFGGVGGNSIQLALAGCHVIAIELDPHKASILRHNTQVYGVQHLVEVICGDFLRVAPRIRADVVVLSPPWGGPEYSQKEKFDVEIMGGNPEVGLSNLLELSFSVMRCSSALVWLPRSSSLNQIEKVADKVAVLASAKDARSGINSRCEVEIATLNGVTKAMTVYFGTAAKFRGLKQ